MPVMILTKILASWLTRCFAVYNLWRLQCLVRGDAQLCPPAGLKETRTRAALARKFTPPFVAWFAITRHFLPLSDYQNLALLHLTLVWTPDMAPAVLVSKPLAHLPTSPIVPRSNLKRKRSSPEATSEDSVAQSDKRRKVAFDPDVEVRRVDEFGGKSILLISEEIKHALKQYQLGSSADYEQIKAIFSQDRLAEDQVSHDDTRKYLVGLTSNATLLTKSFHGLVQIVLDVHWLSFDDSLGALYSRFLGNLVSSQPVHTARVLSKLVDNFAHGVLGPSLGRECKAKTFQCPLPLDNRDSLSMIDKLSPSRSITLLDTYYNLSRLPAESSCPCCRQPSRILRTQSVLMSSMFEIYSFL